MENLEKDGYEFQDIRTVICKIHRSNNENNVEKSDGIKGEDILDDRMYILTNAVQTYGAAGILNKKLIKEFAGSRDFFILPSSIHETIFVRVSNLSEKEMFDSMVREVNETQVDAEERLSDHCYYYDGQTGEIRMCA